jgi:hypothetical protein
MPSSISEGNVPTAARRLYDVARREMVALEAVDEGN